MERRTFLAGTGAMLLGAPRAAEAQPRGKIPVVGELWHAASAEEEGEFFVAVRRGFSDLGYIEGRNIAFEHRFAAEQYEQFNNLAAELARIKVDVLVPVTGPAAIAAKRATATIPIVFILVPDPVASGLVESLARPGGNISGFSTVAIDLTAKRLEIFKQAIAGLSRAALLVNPSAPDIARRTVEDTQRAAALLNLTIQPFEVRSPDELERTFAAIRQTRVGGLVVAPDGMFYNERSRIAQLALAHRLPTIHPSGDTVHAGSLMSYGPNLEAICRRAPVYVYKILKGAKPADLPVEQPTKFDLVINLKTAKALGLTIPPSLLSRADQVIE